MYILFHVLVLLSVRHLSFTWPTSYTPESGHSSRSSLRNSSVFFREKCLVVTNCYTQNGAFPKWVTGTVSNRASQLILFFHIIFVWQCSWWWHQNTKNKNYFQVYKWDRKSPLFFTSLSLLCVGSRENATREGTFIGYVFTFVEQMISTGFSFFFFSYFFERICLSWIL